MIDTFLPIVGSDYPISVVPFLNKAGKNIDIVMYDWRWYANQPGHPVQQFNIALVNAVRRGVLVRALIYRKELVPILSSVGIKARTLREKRTLHTKMILIDSELCIIGSHNLTRNAFGSNIETSLAVSIPQHEDRFRVFFENLWQLP